MCGHEVSCCDYRDVFNGVCIIKHNEVVDANFGSYTCGNTKLPKTLRVVGNNVIGNNCKIGEYVKLENCIVFDNSEIKTGSELENCIVLPTPNHEKFKSHLEHNYKSVVTV